MRKVNIARYIVVVMMAVVAMTALAACGGSATPTATSAPPPTAAVAPTESLIPGDASNPPPESQDGITPEIAARVPVLPPREVTLEHTAGKAVLKWLGSSTNIVHYEVYRKTSDGGDWQLLANPEAVGDNRASYEWVDTTAMSGIDYDYGLIAVNQYGNKSSGTIFCQYSVPTTNTGDC